MSERVVCTGLSKRELEALRMMRDNENGEETDGEMVKEGRVVMVDLEHFSPKTFFALLRRMAITESDGSGGPGGFERWHINSTGRDLLRAAGL